MTYNRIEIEPLPNIDWPFNKVPSFGEYSGLSVEERVSSKGQSTYVILHYASGLCISLTFPLK